MNLVSFVDICGGETRICIVFAQCTCVCVLRMLFRLRFLLEPANGNQPKQKFKKNVMYIVASWCCIILNSMFYWCRRNLHSIVRPYHRRNSTSHYLLYLLYASAPNLVLAFCVTIISPFENGYDWMLLRYFWFIYLYIFSWFFEFEFLAIDNILAQSPNKFNNSEAFRSILSHVAVYSEYSEKVRDIVLNILSWYVISLASTKLYILSKIVYSWGARTHMHTLTHENTATAAALLLYKCLCSAVVTRERVLLNMTLRASAQAIRMFVVDEWTPARLTWQTHTRARKFCVCLTCIIWIHSDVIVEA